MSSTKFSQSFFESTRGRILSLLRRGVRTVEELSDQLGLTDNAVRSHLDSLLRDGLVERRGLQRGVRKPHFTYALTGEAEQLFPKAYHLLLSRLLSVLKRKLPSQELEQVLVDMARSLAADFTSLNGGLSLTDRAQRGLEAIEALGGSAQLEDENDKLVIAGVNGCPFSSIVADHPEVCRMAGIILSEVTGLEVQEICRRDNKARCLFELGNSLQNRENI